MLTKNGEERIMARFMLEATVDREQDIERWEKDMAEAAAAGNSNLVAQIRCRIVDAKRIIADSGY
jgi:hypothetical protein